MSDNNAPNNPNAKVTVGRGPDPSRYAKTTLTICVRIEIHEEAPLYIVDKWHYATLRKGSKSVYKNNSNNKRINLVRLYNAEESVLKSSLKNSQPTPKMV